MDAATEDDPSTDDDARRTRDGVLRVSTNTRLALAAPRPMLRGVLHLIAAVAAVPSTVVLVVLSPTTSGRLALGAFGGGMSAMFSASALLHARRWPAPVHERLLRLDHTGIYLAISGTGVAMGIVGLQGWPGVVLISVMAVGATLGIALEWLPFAPPRGYSNAVYLTLGWVPVALLPWVWVTSGAGTVALIIVGGVLYTLGAVIVGLRRPDPVPAWFGYHELFHLLVVVAVLVHAVMILRLV
ncbi:MAG: hemolysin III family protein [Nitriliruptoraceae bacterium]